VIDVVEDHRLHLRRDATGKAAADRDAHAPLDLFLDPDGSPCNELVGALVEKENRARVGPEDVADAREKHLEKVVELEVGESDIRDGLHVLDPRPRSALGREDPCVLDGDRRAITGELQQLYIARAEPAVRQRSDVKHAEHATADEERYAEHGLDPLLVQNRIEHVGVIDIVEDHRPHLRSDAAGKAAADRDAHASLDLLLDPDGSPSDELIRLLVEQQDSAGIDLEDLARAEKERRQQDIELEMRECRIRERLEPSQSIGIVNALPHAGIVTAIAQSG
jgi:hypothetical protein